MKIVEECIDFGNIECGKTSFTFLHLVNNSVTPTFYQVRKSFLSVNVINYFLSVSN